MKNQIFDVDVKGMRQLQAGKPLWFIIRELVANSLDEEITSCSIMMNYYNGKATIVVEDDYPSGFLDLADSWTLFKDTRKRLNVKQRGRYNHGEKSIICLADYARILTTTGGVEFDVFKGERKQLRRKREKGSEVSVTVRMSQEEYLDCLDYCHKILVPENITVSVNFSFPNQDEEKVTTLQYHKPHKVFSAKLPTELKIDDVMKTVSRDTDVHVHQVASDDTAFIYEMGIPVCEIDCQYSIDVQQKVPLSTDRDRVDGKYLRTLYAEVLNNVIEEVAEEQISQVWIREAVTSDRIAADTVKDIKDKRFGEKAVIENPFDPISNDEAISRGYTLIRANDLSSMERDKLKQFAGVVSSTSMFGKDVSSVTHLDWEKHHYPLARLAMKIAKDFLHVELRVVFYRERNVGGVANYGGRELSFNLAKLSKEFFLADEVDGCVKQEALDLIIHELAHEKGNHTEHSYHECITKMGAWCTKKAIADKRYFKF